MVVGSLKNAIVASVLLFAAVVSVGQSTGSVKAASYSTLATSISTGYDLSCSLRADNTASCWGGMWTTSAPGDGSESSTTPADVVSLSGALAVVAGWEFSCAIDGDRNVRCWGGDYGPTATLVPGISDVSQIDIGLFHVCALKLDGTVWCWGGGTSGQLGDGASTTSWNPVQAMISNVTQIALGHVHSCALLTDQTVRCWGARSNPGPPVGAYWGEVGDGGTNGSLTPVVATGVVNVTQLVAGSNQTCVVLTDGSIKCWGTDQSRTLDVVSCGLGPCFSSTPVVVDGISTVASLGIRKGASGGDATICAITTNGVIQCWGNVWSQGGYAYMETRKPSQAKTMTGFSPSIQVGLGGLHLCSLTTEGRVECLGQGGAVGRGGDVNQTFDAGRVVQIGATPAGAPSNLNATLATATSVYLSWGPPADLGGSLLLDYKIDFSTDGGSTWSVYDDGVSTNTGLTVEDLKLSVLTTYQYRVIARTMVGYGSPAATKEVIVPPVPPSGEVGVSINQSSNYTTDKNVALKIVWPSGAKSIRVSNDGGFDTQSVSSFDPKTPIAWVLDDSIEGRYTKIVYVRFSGLGIDSSRSYSDDIIFDNKAPTVAASTAEQAGAYIVLTLAATDEESGLSKIEVNNVDKTVNADYATTVLVKSSDIGLGVSSASVKKFSLGSLRIRISDKAGNKTSWISLGTTMAPVVTMPKLTMKKSATAKSIAKFAKLTVASTSKVSLKVVSGYAKYCKVTGATLKGLKAGSCKVKVTVTPKKGRAKFKTVTLKVAKS